ncbi:hypothetical protein HPB48_023363 [Haemaphysalis longicornis]|uniref:Peptidase M13 N-terminal domain-containing protein n=1 Tax=Haemaphysalis longicornis TaxID=44386 RepID=A0A9J6H561_HAELO|nr:hypothetical protein HPB48_023363 [Haemaphysalis longicornis]
MSKSRINELSVSVLGLGVSVILFATIVIALTQFIQNRNANVPKNLVCNNPSCAEYARRIRESINLSVDPCAKLYRHVCDGWDATHEGSVLEYEHVQLASAYLRNLPAPRTGQSPLQKAAVFFRSCEDVFHSDRDGTPMLQSLLLKCGVSWPVPKVDPDVVAAVIRLHRLFGLATLLLLTKSSDSDGNASVHIAPSPAVRIMKRKRDAAIAARLHEQHFSSLRNYLAPRNAVRLQTYREFIDVENSTFEYLDRNFGDQDSNVVDSLEALAEITYSISAEYWRRTLEKELGMRVRGNTIRVRVVSLVHLHSFNSLLAELGQEAVLLYVGWVALQFIGPYVSRHLAELARLGNGENERQERVSQCLSLTERFIDWNLLGSHSAGLNDSSRSPLVELVQAIGESLRSAARGAPWLSKFVGDLPTTFTVDYAIPSAEEEQSDFASADDMSSDLLLNWINVTHRRGETRDPVVINAVRHDHLPIEKMHFLRAVNGTLMVPAGYASPLLFESELVPAVRFGSFGLLASVSMLEASGEAHRLSDFLLHK